MATKKNDLGVATNAQPPKPTEKKSALLGNEPKIIVADDTGSCNPVDANNILDNFINSDDTKENDLHENASAASVNDGEASASPDLSKSLDQSSDDSKDELNWESESDSVPEKLKDIPKKYWKHQTV